jgi:hypothetical protein
MLDQIPAAIIGALIMLIGERTWRWRRPKVSAETGMLARKSVTSAKQVFNASIAMGGHLQYPWKLNDGGTLLVEALIEDLRQAAARVNNKTFTTEADVIKKELHLLWAATPAPSGKFFVLGMEDTAGQEARMESDERIAGKQREAAEAGLAHIEPALVILDRLERHS